MRRLSSHVAILAILAVLLAVPAFAGGAVITNGIDLWKTPAAGGTFVDFSKHPLPAGFFCPNSAPYTTKVVLKGVPIKTNPANALHGADTIIQRLDDAAFAKSLPAISPFPMRGDDGNVRQVDASFFSGREVATTRVQVKAISFVGIRPVETGCGAYLVKASLAGEQPVTEMIIVRDNENGGSFYAPLSLNIRLIFTPVNGGAPLELVRPLQFPAKPLSAWTEVPAKRNIYSSFVGVDTDADGVVDLMLPGTSNFSAGFKGVPSGGRRGGIDKVAYAGVPYCGGTGVYYADDCHATDPILLNQ
jgi:hypothetical protein